MPRSRSCPSSITLREFSAWFKCALLGFAAAACAPLAAQICSTSQLQLTEDASDRITGTGVVVAGRPHDLRIAVARRNPMTGVCSIDTSFNGSLTLKIWRTDVAGAWVAPSLASPALSLPATKPGAPNATISFSAGLANLSLLTSNVGLYDVNVTDESLATFPATIGGVLPALTVRPFALVLGSVASGSTANPAAASPEGALFARAGAPFSAAIGAYRWSAAADGNDDGRPDAAATAAQVLAGGVATGFAGPISLALLPGSQLPASGVLGTLLNPTISLAGGAGSTAALRYSEVGSFRLETAAALTAYQGKPGADVDLVVADPSSANGRNDRIGRFAPDHFDLVAEPACGTGATAFAYSGQPFPVRVVARSALIPSTVTRNYDSIGGYAKDALLSAVSPVGLGTLANPSVPSSSFNAGVATLAASSGPSYTFLAKLTPPATLALRAVDPDTVSSENWLEAPVVIRSGRLRVFGANGSERLSLDLPLQVQHWSGNAWAPGTDDTCSTLTLAHVALSGRTNPAASYPIESVSLSSGSGRIRLGVPSSSSGSAAGSIDIALNLGTEAVDRSCLGTHGGAPAFQPWLQSQNGACATAFDRDPSARATFGIFSAESRRQIHVREVR